MMLSHLIKRVWFKVLRARRRRGVSKKGVSLAVARANQECRKSDAAGWRAGAADDPTVARMLTGEGRDMRAITGAKR
jgi:hypothetical protein